MSAHALSLEHSESIISILDEYNAAFSMCHDYWLLNACEIAVMNLLSEKSLRGPTEDYLAKGCKLLYSMGQHKPQAHRILANISKVVGESKTVVSDRVQTILRDGSVRVRPIIVGDVSYLKLQGDEAGTLAVARISFNESIENIEN
jgi:hypothetical protein